LAIWSQNETYILFFELPPPCPKNLSAQRIWGVGNTCPCLVWCGIIQFDCIELKRKFLLGRYRKTKA